MFLTYLCIHKLNSLRISFINVKTVHLLLLYAPEIYIKSFLFCMLYNIQPIKSMSHPNRMAEDKSVLLSHLILK